MEVVIVTLPTVIVIIIA